MPSATAGHGIGVDIESVLKAAGIIGLWTYVVATGRVFADHAMAITYGVDPEQAAHGVAPEVFLKSYHPDDRPVASHAFKMAVAHCADYNARYRIIHDDGGVSLIEARGRPYVSQGVTVSMTGANFDVSGSRAGETGDPLGARTRLALDFLARRGWASNGDGLGLISGRQMRAARSLLNWSVTQLAEASGVPTAAVIRLERNDGATMAAADTVRQIRANLEMAGVGFAAKDGVLLAR